MHSDPENIAKPAYRLSMVQISTQLQVVAEDAERRSRWEQCKVD